jgi:energy-coupling factor transport system substrate-specific component
MLSAIGTHGPTVSPIVMGLLNTVFLAVAVWLLVKPQKNSETWFLPLLLFVGLATLSRIALSFIPNVMPVTIMAVMVGSKFGAQRGVSFAILVTLASNAVLGHGWWSLFQMIGWGSVAAVASLMSVHDSSGNLSMNRLLFSSLWSVPIFSIIVSFSILDSSMSMIEFGLYIANGLLYDVLHFLGNVFFAMWFGQWFERLLSMNEPHNRLVQQEDEHVSTF